MAAVSVVTHDELAILDPNVADFGGQSKLLSILGGVEGTDQYGRFLLRGIPPGEYKLLAWEELEPRAYLDENFLRPIEEKAQLSGWRRAVG